MAVNVHAPYGKLPDRLNPSRHQAAPPRPALHPRGLALWVQPGEGQDIDPAVWAKAAEAVLARARKLAPGAEVLLWPAAGAAKSGDDESDAGNRPAAATNPPVSLAVRRSSVAVDLAADTVLLDGVPVSFTAMEHSLLRYLVENLSRAIPREELQRFLESLDCPGAAFRSIDVYVGRVRRKLGSGRHVIATVRGGGYQFVPGPGSTVRGPAEYCI
ncbi:MULTISPECIES: winged helix-turn-helix domain-containing protein [Arthrobacter]|uniref:Winged helix family transcriptional regulator n=1 Tax=Arthrobacter terricola TaxID=2547396 RepID=A0A4R5KR42_9MICC|nr:MULTISPECIES: winged helix-turn-helix domain-containing protein [Arthrobacter]MBT8160677.1 winged helix-turn-helix domain-containing protein [Arthrobacter sp. GN70]TDF97832.1 winged helix family transcriptional regulator [Arthrobacter terricola]